MAGFKCFTQAPVVAEPTIKEKIVALAPATKQSILKAYINGKDYKLLSIETGISEELLHTVYDQIDLIQERSAQNLRGEIVVTPAVTHNDPITNEVIVDVPAVMNVPVTTQAALATYLEAEFGEYFTPAIITAIVNAMVSWCKYDNTGTWAFYKSQIIL